MKYRITEKIHRYGQRKENLEIIVTIEMPKYKAKKFSRAIKTGKMYAAYSAKKGTVVFANGTTDDVWDLIHEDFLIVLGDYPKQADWHKQGFLDHLPLRSKGITQRKS